MKSTASEVFYRTALNCLQRRTLEEVNIIAAFEASYASLTESVIHDCCRNIVEENLLKNKNRNKEMI